MERGYRRTMVLRPARLAGTRSVAALAACRTSSSALLEQNGCVILEELGRGECFSGFRSAVIEGVRFLDQEAIFCPGTAHAEGFRPL
jgi:hypothetical protein